MFTAAVEEHLGVLKLAKSNGVPSDTSTISSASNEVHVGALLWVLFKSYYSDESIFSGDATGGRVLEWVSPTDFRGI